MYRLLCRRRRLRVRIDRFSVAARCRLLPRKATVRASRRNARFVQEATYRGPRNFGWLWRRGNSLRGAPLLLIVELCNGGFHEKGFGLSYASKGLSEANAR